MTTTTTIVELLGERAVGLTGPIGATVDGTTATGTVDTWRAPSLALPDIADGTLGALGGLLVVVLAVAATTAALCVLWWLWGIAECAVHARRLAARRKGKEL